MSQIKQSYDRILEISDDHKQITLPDSRYYRRNGEFYPSITFVLQIYPKGKQFENWLKQVGFASEYIVKKASEDGTKVHELVESYLLGKELSFLNKHGQPQYDSEVWKMFLKFVEFWETFKPKLVETEVHLFSDELKVAGTCDLIVEIDGELWLLDIKTSNQIHSTYELQTSIYTQCYKECYGKKIQRQGILWLKSTKRGPKKDKIQGKGWEIVESERSQEENLEIFKIVKRLFDLENPEAAPIYESFRTSAKREDV
jgi:ATP-dependent exoDNAse (exonuclease V) beta subunit